MSWSILYYIPTILSGVVFHGWYFSIQKSSKFLNLFSRFVRVGNVHSNSDLSNQFCKIFLTEYLKKNNCGVANNEWINANDYEIYILLGGLSQ